MMGITNIVLLLFALFTTDYTDLLLIEKNAAEHAEEINFEEISKYYGLKIRKIILTEENLSESLFVDEAGQPIDGVYILSESLEDTILLDSSEFTILYNQIAQGIPIFVDGVSDEFLPRLSLLTDYSISGAINNTEENKTYFVTSLYPQISLEFTGTRFNIENGYHEYVLLIDSTVNPLIGFTTSLSDSFYVLAYYNVGQKQIFVQSKVEYDSHNLGNTQMYKLYKPNFFTLLIPKMFFVRYVGGNECWHSNTNYANLTIDDPKLVNPFGYLDYNELLSHMMQHNFHTTIAFVPKNYNTSQPDVIELFLSYPDYLSITQHGNNHDGYEFCFYDQYPIDSMCAIYQNWWCDSSVAHPRSLKEQEADIVEGLTRLCEHYRITQIPFSKVMVFPYGISPSLTLKVLKKYNYLATVNSSLTGEIPIGEEPPTSFDFRMRPACMNYHTFPSILRYPAISRFWGERYFYKTKFDLFIDKPLFLYDHHSLFSDDYQLIDEVVDSINSIYGGVVWKSLDYILKRMYLEKENDDGTWDILCFTNDIIVENNSEEEKWYHFKKLENFDVPISAVELDGIQIPFYSSGDTLLIDFSIPPMSYKEIKIKYSSGVKDFAIPINGIFYDPDSGVLAAIVFNYGSEGGAAPVEFFDGSPDSGGVLLGIVTAEWIYPDSCALVELKDIYFTGQHHIYAIVDPFDLIDEIDETNNAADILLSSPTSIKEQKSDYSAPGIFNFEISLSATLTSKFYLRYMLPRPSYVEIVIYNVSGRLRKSVYKGYEKAGEHRLLIDTKKAGNLRSGVYFVVLYSCVGTKVDKFIILR